MTAVSQIISDAYRESNITPLAGAPNTNQMAEGLTLLQRVLSSVYGFEIGDKLTDLPIGDNIVVPYQQAVFPIASVPIPLNTRVIVNYAGPQTAFLDPSPQDGSMFCYVKEGGSTLTVSGNGRRISGGATVVLDDANSGSVFVYSSNGGGWNLISPLTLAGTMPFGVEFDDLFVTGLAMRLNPRYTITTSAETGMRFKEMLAKFRARYQQAIQVGSDPALILLPGTRHDRGYYTNGLYNTQSVFNRGFLF